MVVLVFQYSYNNFLYFLTSRSEVYSGIMLLNIENGDNNNIEKQEQNQSAAETWLVWYPFSLLDDRKQKLLRKPCPACLIQAVKNDNLDIRYCADTVLTFQASSKDSCFKT